MSNPFPQVKLSEEQKLFLSMLLQQDNPNCILNFLIKLKESKEAELINLYKQERETETEFYAKFNAVQKQKEIVENLFNYFKELKNYSTQEK